jgi:hypothetical protein
MNESIRKRIQAVESRNQNKNVPDLVQIYKDDSLGWIAQETYTKKNSKGGVISKSGNVKRILLTSPKDYEPPEGFKGVIINEGNIDD